MSEQNKSNKIQEPVDYAGMMLYINGLTEKYKFLSYTSIGETILGKSIPLISIGEGRQEILYVGAHQANGWKESACLLRFINELCDLIYTKSKIYYYDSLYLFKTKTISIIPMLNPDGVDYYLNGISESNPLFERALKINEGSADFSCWSSNARGVDLDKNYIFSDKSPTYLTENDRKGKRGEWPESERETGSLCNYLRYNTSISFVLSTYSLNYESLHFNEILTSVHKTARISQLFDKKIITNDNKDLEFGLSRWCETNTRIPVVSVVDYAKASYTERYFRIREGLFCIPAIF